MIMIMMMMIMMIVSSSRGEGSPTCSHICSPFGIQARTWSMCIIIVIITITIIIIIIKNTIVIVIVIVLITSGLKASSAISAQQRLISSLSPRAARTLPHLSLLLLFLSFHLQRSSTEFISTVWRSIPHPTQGSIPYPIRPIQSWGATSIRRFIFSPEPPDCLISHW